VRRLAVAAMVLCATACDGGADEDAARPCAGLLLPAKAEASLPTGLPAGIDGATFYELQKVGSTRLHHARAAGDDIVAVRDAVERAYTDAGITIEGRDAEPPAEAELQWSVGDREGSVRVTPLCEGYVRLIYRVGPR